MGPIAYAKRLLTMLDKTTAVLEQNIETLQVLSEAGTKAATPWSSTLDSAPLGSTQS